MVLMVAAGGEFAPAGLEHRPESFRIDEPAVLAHDDPWSASKNGDWLRVSCMCMGFVGTVVLRPTRIEEFRSLVMLNKRGVWDTIL